jgi:hypothetical protein
MSVKLCKECEHLKPNRYCIDALKDRQYLCSKYSMGIILKKPEDVETLECVNKDEEELDD